MLDKKELRLYFIMGSTNTNRDPAHVLQRAIDGGVTAFQYREKGSNALTGTEKLKLGIALRNVCLENNIPFIVNDDIELAIKLYADGVHIGQQDESVDVVRERLPAHISIGVSVSTVEEALIAEAQGANYLGVGPIFPTSTKADAREPIGMEKVREIGLITSLPIVAIGGINKDNARMIMESGIAGISVISAISEAENIRGAAWELSLVIEGGDRKSKKLD